LVASVELPTDAELFTLLNKPMLIKVMVWEFNDKSGNWISKVSPRSQQSAPAPVAQPAPVQQDYSEDMPF